jgi:ubiquinone/menaquinone biosynthesis C-methylase UbiE
MKIKGFKDTIDWYDANAKEYADAIDSFPPTDLLDQFIHILPNKPKILDAGCGSGRDTGLLNSKGANTIGLDISQGLLQEAKKRNPGCSLIQGSFLELPFEDSTFDGVWAHAALVHLETIDDVKKSLNEFYRVLKNKGILHIYVKKQMGSKKTEVIKDTLSNHERFFRYYSEDEIKSYVEKTELKIIDFTIRKDPHGREEIRWISLFAQK